jgi:PKD repeat protein
VPGGAAIVGDPSANSITVIFANLGGTISVRETNAAGCITNHTPKAITVNPLPTATISGGGTICDGGSRNLSVDFTGTGPYFFTYALNGVPQVPVATAADPYTLNVTLAGTYTIVNVSDVNCTNTGTGTTTVTYFPKPTGIISGTGEMCLGGSKTLTMTFTGTAPFDFTYFDGTTPVTVTGHLTNVYTTSVSPVTNTTYTLTSLTDGNTCTGVVSGSAIITINLPPALSLSGTNLICYGVNTGAVNMTITDGTAPFGISWNGPSGFTSSSEDISSLAAGYYAVVVTDTKGCTGNANITLTQPPVLAGSAAGTNITCFGAADGTITISGASGGSGSLEFSVGSGWQVSPVFSSLIPGSYNVQMRDAGNPTCILTLNGALLLTQPAVLNATVVRTDVNCFGANNGSIVISAPSGGYGTYGYSINGGSTWQGSGNFTNLAPNTYDVRIRDAANMSCEKVLNAAMVVTEPVVLSATLNSTNVTCFGAGDGTITVSAPAGGHGTYEYSINGGGSWQASGSYTGLIPGTYNVQIRDAGYTSCFKVLNASLAITQPSVLQATVASTNVTCNSTSDGTISITAPLGGYGTYDYTINGGTSWEASGSYTTLAPGTYDVRIRDAAHTGCVIILNAGLQITQPAALSATVIDTDISCFGSNDGVIQITNSAGGYGTYQYSTNGGGAWQDGTTFSGLLPGTYNVQIRDKAHITCVKILDAAVVISEPAVLSATVTSTNVTCNSSADGTITISSPSGGYGSYGYSINGGTSWQGSGNFTNLAPGTYNIRIRDAVNTGCIIALNPAVVITQPAILTGTIVKTNVTCNGTANGTITINGAAGGYGTYEYTINGGTSWQGSNSFTGLIPGFYNVKIRDAANTGCIITLNGSLNVTEPSVLNANVAKTNVTCNGANNGTITLSSPTGGYGTYEYSVNGAAGPWQSSGSFTALPPATYDVMIRDAAQTACVITLNGSLIITEPSVLAATVTPTMVTCFGANNGIIAITGAAGGYGTYEYTINGGTTWSGLGNFTNLAPNTYDVRIRDAANTTCVIILDGALIITQPAVLSATIAKTNITCFGAGDGTITITAPAGGYGTYEYSINGGGSWQASGSFTALGPGNYNVQIHDAAHTSCVIVLNNSLQITQPAILNAVVTPTNVTCNGANDGKITITAPTGGSGSYEYSIDGGLTWPALAGLFTALPPATYDVRIRDAVNTACVIVLNNALTITEPAVITANVNSTNVTCFGANDGTITITGPNGGYGTYEYSKDGGGTWQASGTYTNLTPVSYNVQIRDKAHTSCVIVLNAALFITEPAVLSATVASTNITCFGANNGTITISAPAGGYGTYSYSVNGGASWQGSGNFTSLAPATYVVKIRDAANTACQITLNAGLILTEPAVLSATVAKTNVTCFGAGDGTITISAPGGGYGTYGYSINGGTSWQGSGNYTALIPGFYNVQIRDAANTGCVVILNGSLQITQPSVLSANVVKTNVTCFGANDGTITISSPTGGYGTYEYSIDGTAWQSSGNFTALIPSTYNVQIRDAANTGCFIVLNGALVITEPAVLNATVTPTMVTCFGASDGIITITSPTGGYGTYQYSKNGGTSWQGTGTFTNLAPANYDVRMRDAANPACELILNASLAITQQAILSATVAKTNVSCYGGSDGTITISSPSGGYGTYEYSINGGGSWQASGNFTSLVPGNYNVQIRDAAHTSCVIVLNSSLAVTQPAVLNAVVTPTNVTCNGANDGKIIMTASAGGSGNYDYSIDGGVTWQSGSGSFNGLAPSTYNVQIRDAANITCIIILNSSVTITEPAVLSATVASSNVTCNGANDGTITVSLPTGGYGTYEYSIDGSTWQATGVFSALAPVTYNVQIRDKAHTGCVAVLNPALAITEPAVLSATVNSTNVTCFGANNGTITISAPLGGYGTYSYSVNGGTTWQASGTFTNLAPANYNVKMRDAAHISCEITLNASLPITQPAVLSATVASTNVTCFGAGDGTITITNPLGGYGTYQYTVNGGTTWQASGNFTALIPGFYNVQIRDAANAACVITLNGSLQITQPQVLSAFDSKTNVTCNGGSDGTITVMGATGGYGTYEYSIDGGTGWQSSGSFTGLLPATYNVQIRDAAHTGCVIVIDAALVIAQPAVLSATVTPTMVTCFGANDGKITITSPAGGYGTYQYSVNGTTWQGSGTFTNLPPATYPVMIRDAANLACVVTINPGLVITQPPILSASIASTNVTCFGGGDGSITISSPSGGYGTYEYSINGGGSWQPSGSFTALSPGSYNILIRDAAHTSCIIVLNSAYAVTQPGLLSATVAKTDVTCNGANNGKITITAPAGGYGTYEYSINGGSTWQVSGSYTNLVPGTYDVRIHDAAHTACSVILYPNLVITEPLILTMTSTGDVMLNCFGDNTGSGTFFALGGTLPYNFVVVSNTAGATVAFPGFNSESFFGAHAGLITVSVTDVNGCFAQATININQPALLTPGTIAANQVLCSGDNPAQLTESAAPAGGPGAYSYQWQYSSNVAGPFINIAGATTFQYTPPAGATNTIYYRRMVTSGVCTPVYSNVIGVTVNPLPVAILTGGETICPAQTSILKVNMMVGTGPFELNIENHGTITGYVSGADIVVTPAVTTTYKLLSVKDANGCQVLSPSANLIGTATVTVRALPAITTSPVSKIACEFGIVTFSVAATGSDLTYQWLVNEGSGFNPVTDGGVYFGATNSTLSIFGATRLMTTYVYHAVVTGCSTSVTSGDATLTVNTVPEIVTQPKDSTVCTNAGATFNVTATGTAVTYQWQVNKGSGFVNVADDSNFSGSALSTLTVTNAPATFNNYILRVVVSGTCGVPVYSNFAVLRVNVAPTVALNPVNKVICDGSGPVVFTANGSGSMDSLRWQVFSAAIWSDIEDNTIYSGTTSQQLTLSNIPLALNGNQYRLALKAKCTTVYTNGATLTVNANPVVNFSAIDPVHACGSVPLVMNGNPSGGSGTYSQHLWSGDIGPLTNYFVQSPTFNSQIAGTYVLNYKVTDNKGCSGNDDVTVIVDAPEAAYVQDKNNGCTPLTISFTKDMTGVAKFWWDFGDDSPKDSVTANPVHLFSNSTPSSIVYRTATLTVQSAGGCLDTFTSSVTVYPAIDASFTATPGIVCSGNSIALTAKPGASKYFWDYGDGTSGYSPNESTTHLYTNFTIAPEVQAITLTTTSFYNCTDVKTVNITVMPVPLPQFAALPVSQIYSTSGNPVTFTNATNEGTWNWLWKFGDGATSTVQNPSHTYTALGDYKVTLIVSNENCSDSIDHQVSVTPIPPVAGFDPIPSGCEPLNLTINNTTLNTEFPVTTYKWDFGDGGTSNAKNPTYTYFDPGTYRVELTVTGPGGTSSISQVVNAYPSPKAYFEVSPMFVFINDEKVRGFNLSQGADSYLWEFGDGDTSKLKEPFHKYMEAGVFDITLWAYLNNPNGVVCSDKYVLSPGVTVEPAGEVRFSTVFTPNLDGPIERTDLPTSGTELDQFFFPPIREKVINYKLQIFNRLGVLIFQSGDINVPWNGYYKGKLCPQGVYIWYVEGKYANGMPFKKVGDVTLLH